MNPTQPLPNPTAQPAQPAPPAAAPPPAAMPSTGQPAGMQQPHLNPAYTGGGLATASLILGIISLPASILNILSLPIPVTGLVLGIVGMKKRKGFAITGIILSVIGMILSILVLVIGTHYLNKSKSSTSSSSSSGSSITAPCYKFDLPSDFKSGDITKNDDCITKVLSKSGAGDLYVNSGSVSSNVNSSNVDSYLKAAMDKLYGAAGSGIKQTNSKYLDLDGARAYMTYADENDPQYKHGGYMLMYANKDYLSAGGEKLRLFVVAYDSPNSTDMLDQVAKSWHWQ